MAVSEEIMLKVENVSKVYKLGEIGGTTLRDELQRLHAKIHKKEDPTKKIGAKNYNKGEKFKALDNISFEVKKGERIGIIGHNGAGKSTLLKLISRVTGPSEGNIYLNGRVASMLEVGTGFHPELTGRENIYMNGAILGMTKKEIDAKMEDIIEFSEVRQFIDTPVKRYSSGMYVKLAFSVAAHLDSEIMIMDEVLAVGDVAFQNKCLAKMKEVSEQCSRTILYVSHNMNTIRQLCDSVIVLNQGSIIFSGDVEKGISVYTNRNLLNKSSFVTFTKDMRKMNHANSLELLNIRCISNRQTSDHQITLEFETTWNCLLSSETIGIRASIVSLDDLPIASFVSNNNISSAAGDKNRTKFSMVMKYFLPGDYFLNLSLYTFDDGGRFIALDNIQHAIMITLGYSNDKVSIPNWNVRKLGYLHFNGVEIIENGKIE